MKNNSISKILKPATHTMILCFLLAAGVSAVAQSANGETGNGGCSNRMLSGDYAYAINSTSLTIPPVGPLAILGRITADGKGSFSGSVNGTLAGTIITDVPVTGTYSVASDCTGTLTTVYPAHTAHFSLVLVEGVKGCKRAELHTNDAGEVGTGTVNQ